MRKFKIILLIFCPILFYSQLLTDECLQNETGSGASICYQELEDKYNMFINDLAKDLEDQWDKNLYSDYEYIACLNHIEDRRSFSRIVNNHNGSIRFVQSAFYMMDIMNFCSKFLYYNYLPSISDDFKNKYSGYFK